MSDVRMHVRVCFKRCCLMRIVVIEVMLQRHRRTSEANALFAAVIRLMQEEVFKPALQVVPCDQTVATSIRYGCCRSL